MEPFSPRAMVCLSVNQGMLSAEKREANYMSDTERRRSWHVRLNMWLICYIEYTRVYVGGEDTIAFQMRSERALFTTIKINSMRGNPNRVHFYGSYMLLLDYDQQTLPLPTIFFNLPPSSPKIISIKSSFVMLVLIW